MFKDGRQMGQLDSNQDKTKGIDKNQKNPITKVSRTPIPTRRAILDSDPVQDTSATPQT